MTTALLIVAYVLLALLALVALVVALPFHARARAEANEAALAGQLRVTWAWGVVSVRASGERGPALYVLGLRLARLSSAADTADKKRRKPKQAKDQAPAGARARWARQHRRYLMDVAGRMWRALRIRLHAQGVLGLDDPADTFVLFELLHQLERVPGVQLDLRRDYFDDTMDVEVELRGRVWLPGFAALALTLLVKPETWRVLRARP